MDMYFKNKFIITNIFLKESIFLLLGIESRDLNLFIIVTRNMYNLFLHLMDGRKYEKTHKMDDFFSVKQIVVIAPSITKYPPAKKICQRSKAITRPPLRTSITVLVSQGQLEIIVVVVVRIPLGVIRRSLLANVLEPLPSALTKQAMSVGNKPSPSSSSRPAPGQIMKRLFGRSFPTPRKHRLPLEFEPLQLLYELVNLSLISVVHHPLDADVRGDRRPWCGTRFKLG